MDYTPPHALHLLFPSVSKCTPDKPPTSMAHNMVISAIVHLLGVSIVSHLISRRVLVDGVQCSLKRASWPRLCVLIVFADSYLFLFTAGILILGVGMATSPAACSLGIYLCIVFYGTSKLFIYLFLGEFYLPLGMATVILSVSSSRTGACRLASNSHVSPITFQSICGVHDSPHSLLGCRRRYVLW